MPVAKSSKQLIGTGANKTLAYLLSDDFCFKAKKAGRVAKIDTKNNLAILMYDDGTKDAIDLDDKLSKNSNMGFYIHQKFKLVYKENEHFDEGDVIAYNPDYFTGKGKDVDYKPGVLAKVAIASGDFSFEDSTFVSEKLCEKCAGKINMLSQTVLGKNAVIHKIVDKGDKVQTGDSLIEFTTSFDDEDTNLFLQKLSSALSDEQVQELTYEKKVAKYAGEITKVEILYNCPETELSESLQKLIKKIRGRLADRSKAVEGIRSNVHIQPLEQVSDKKNNKAEFPEDGGVIINIWVEYIDTLGMGDKITFMTALKGVVSRIASDSISPLCDYRPEDEIEAICTPSGIIGRMTGDIYFTLYGNKVLVELGKQIREI